MGIRFQIKLQRIFRFNSVGYMIGVRMQKRMKAVNGLYKGVLGMKVKRMAEAEE